MSSELILGAPEMPLGTGSEAPLSPPAVSPSSVWQMPSGPPVVVQNLPADGGWTSQSWATIIAACIALAAALLALFGVLYTQRVSRATAKAQLRQQRAAMIRQERQHANQLAEQARQHEASLREQRDSQARAMQAANRRQIQNDRLSAVVEAAEAIKNFRVRATTYRAARPSRTEDSNGVFDAITRCATAKLRLQLLGLSESAKAFSAAEVAISTYLSTSPGEETEAAVTAMSHAESTAMETFQSELITKELDALLDAPPSPVSQMRVENLTE